MAMRDLLTKDFGWKLFSLALAVAIWLIVQTIRNESTRTFPNLPVLVVSASADVREFKINPGTVEIAVSGRPDVMAALADKEIHATVDLTDIETARDLRKRVDVSTPPGVTVLRVTPPYVDVVVPPDR
jgi:hypothetical protein